MKKLSILSILINTSTWKFMWLVFHRQQSFSIVLIGNASGSMKSRNICNIRDVRSNTPMFFIVPLETAACHVAAAAATSKTFNTICEWERKRHRAISVIELDPCIVFYAFGSPMNIKQIFFIFIILEIQYFLDIKSLLYWIPIFKNY